MEGGFQHRDRSPPRLRVDEAGARLGRSPHRRMRECLRECCPVDWAGVRATMEPPGLRFAKPRSGDPHPIIAAKPPRSVPHLLTPTARVGGQTPNWYCSVGQYLLDRSLQPSARRIPGTIITAVVVAIQRYIARLSSTSNVSGPARNGEAALFLFPPLLK